MRLLRRGEDSVKLSTKGAVSLALLTGGVFIAGLGGLGGWLLEHMLRLGPEFIRAADGDVFDESNLDRQLLSSPLHIGQVKAAAAAERAAFVAPQVRFEAVPEFVTEDNCAELLSGCRLALDGLDSAAARLTLERGCAKLGIPLVHGAVGGWFLKPAPCRLAAACSDVSTPAGGNRSASAPTAPSSPPAPPSRPPRPKSSSPAPNPGSGAGSSWPISTRWTHT